MLFWNFRRAIFSLWSSFIWILILLRKLFLIKPIFKMRSYFLTEYSTIFWYIILCRINFPGLVFLFISFIISTVCMSVYTYKWRYVKKFMKIKLKMIKKSPNSHIVMGMDTNKLTSLRPLYMGIIENVAPKRST